MMTNLMTILERKVFISSNPRIVLSSCPPPCGHFSIQESATGGLSYKVKKNSIHTWQINVLRASLKKTPAFIYFESSSFYISAKQTFHLPAASPYRKASRISRLPSPLSSLQSQTHSHFPEERRSAGFLQLQQVQVL